jgi:hypothetical protein
MKSKIQISIILVLIISFITFLVINEKKDVNNSSYKKTVEENLNIDNLTLSSTDSILILFDNKIEEQKIERNRKSHDIDSLSQSLHDKKLILISKDMKIEEKIVELNKLLRELDDKKKLAEEQSKIAQEQSEIAKKMKKKAKEERGKAAVDGERYREIVHQLEAENNIITKEVEKLKEECLRLNKLLGNNYNINEIDSIINLPDSIKVVSKKLNKRKKKK